MRWAVGSAVSEDFLATGRERTLPEDGQLLAAEVALRLDDTETAERLYRESLEQAATPDELGRALSGLGQLAFRNGDPRTAIERLEEARALSGRQAVDPARRDTLGRAYAMVGELETAIGVFEHSLGLADRSATTSSRACASRSCSPMP